MKRRSADHGDGAADRDASRHAHRLQAHCGAADADRLQGYGNLAVAMLRRLLRLHANVPGVAPNIVTEQVPIPSISRSSSKNSSRIRLPFAGPSNGRLLSRSPSPFMRRQTREVSYVVPVAKQVERQVPQTTFRPVTENKVVNYTVMVPQRVERQVTVPVCTMVPKQVTYAVPRHVRRVAAAAGNTNPKRKRGHSVFN